MATALPDKALVLTVTELCIYLKMNRESAYRLIRAGRLPAFKVGYHWRVSREEIERWLVEREKKT